MRKESTGNTLSEYKLNFGSFSYYRNAIYGFAALWIVVFHGVLLSNINDEFDPAMLFYQTLSFFDKYDIIKMKVVLLCLNLNR